MLFTVYSFKTFIVVRDIARDPLARFQAKPLDIEIEVAHMSHLAGPTYDRVYETIRDHAVDAFNGTTLVHNEDPARVDMMNLADASLIHLVVVDHVSLAGIAEDLYKSTETETMNYMMYEQSLSSSGALPPEKQMHPYRATVRSGSEASTYLRTGSEK